MPYAVASFAARLLDLVERRASSRAASAFAASSMRARTHVDMSTPSSAARVWSVLRRAFSIFTKIAASKVLGRGTLRLCAAAIRYASPNAGRASKCSD